MLRFVLPAVGVLGVLHAYLLSRLVWRAGLPLAIPFALGAYEAAYLLFVPDTRWFARRLSAKQAAADAERRRELRATHLPMLQDADRRRFEQLETVYEEIAAQAGARDDWYGEMIRKLAFLQERFLVFGGREAAPMNDIWELARVPVPAAAR